MLIALSILSMIAAILPVVMRILGERAQENKDATNALVQLDISSLRQQLELQKQQSVSEGHPPGPGGPQ